MKFSEAFEIKTPEKEDWFDPILSLDTELFIDPFLLYDLESEEFEGSHDQIIEFFNSAFLLVAKSSGNHASRDWKKAVSIMHFPEVEELCLGYTAAGTSGLGSGKEVAKLITHAFWNAIRLGKENIEHFEEVQLFGTGIGPDRISDATAKLIRKRLMDYTQRICSKHDVPVRDVVFREGYFCHEDFRWKALKGELPRNPVNGKPILLVPKKYLRTLPSINPDSFWDYCYSGNEDFLREEFGEYISRRVDKKTILELASKHTDLEEEYMENAANQNAEPYDLRKDPQGLYEWYCVTAVSSSQAGYRAHEGSACLPISHDEPDTPAPD